MSDVRRTQALVVLALIAAPLVAAPAFAADETARRWGVGIELGPLELPHADAGIPIGSTAHLPIAVTLRWQINGFSAVTGGLGIPQALGASISGGYEVFHRLARERRGIVALELYAAPGLQLGFAGPDEAARRSDAFVGFQYIYQGPLAFAFRFPVGARLCWLHDRFDTYVESSPALVVTPSVEVLFGLIVGAHVRF
jgi:hypothetical protein